MIKMSNNQFKNKKKFNKILEAQKKVFTKKFLENQLIIQIQ